MKTLKLALVVVAMFVAAPLFAQWGVEATVPFSFYVGNSQLMPSGTYRIACSANRVLIRNCDGGGTVMHLTLPSDKRSKEKSTLKFRKYGDIYFLSEAQGPTLSTGLVIPVEKNEKKVQNDEARVRTFETITLPKGAENKSPDQ
jgi:hypothetical protein